MSYGQFPQAVTAIQRGIAKGNVASLPSAQISLGLAQFKAGNKAEALKAFKAVKGDANLERIAKLWSLRVK